MTVPFLKNRKTMATQNYKAGYSGSTTGSKTGQLYRFDAGDEIPAPKGEFDHDSGIKEVKGGEKSPKKEGAKPTSDNTVDEIKEYLDSKEIEYDSKAKKAELLDLVE